jgi:uncharacterized protein YndB with AHSA1/START domain
MLKTVAIIIVILVVALLAYAATQPDSFRVERSITINAPPTAVFPLLDDYRRWFAWSPWEKKDPGMQRAYGGASSGTGAVYEWSGNSAVGTGRMEITRSVPPSKLVVDLHFIKPFEARNTAEFTLVDHGGTTTVTWAMYGPSPYLSKLMCLFVSMDKMVGGDFEAGLAALKTVAEKSM